jgi:hypothetical protein
MQEGSTLKAIRLTQLRVCPKHYKKIVPKLFEQTMYVRKSQPLHCIIICSSKIQLTLPSHPCLGLPWDLFLSDFLTKILCAFPEA